MAKNPNKNYDSKLILLILGILVVYMIAEFFFLADLTYYLDDQLIIAYKYMPDISENFGVGVRALFVFFTVVLALSNNDIQRNKEKNELLNVLSFTFFILSAVALTFIDKIGYFSKDALTFAYPLSLIYIIYTNNRIAQIYHTWLLSNGKGDLKDDFGLNHDLMRHENSHSFNWKVEWKLRTVKQGKEHFEIVQGFVNVSNPFQGIYVLGGAGAGKSYTVAVQMIIQLVLKSYTGLIYDFKFDDLTQEVIKEFLRHRIGDPKAPQEKFARDKRKLYQVNFTKMEQTHRINPLKPENLESVDHAKQLIMALLCNLDKSYIGKRDFWKDSSINYLLGITWFLRVHTPQYCTLAHVIAMASSSSQDVLNMLIKSQDVAPLIRPFLDAAKLQAGQQLAGMVSGVQTLLGPLASSPNILWVLSGDDVPLDLNNSDNPGILCLGNSAELREAISPVAGVIATVYKNSLNKPNRLPSVFMLDEGPTIFIPSVTDLPATGRSNLVAFIIFGQDYSQFVANYSQNEADQIVSNCGTQFYGMSNDSKTAEKASKIFGDAPKVSVSTSRNLGGNNDSDGSFSQNYQKTQRVTAAEIMSQPTGHFAGKVAGVTSKELEAKGKNKRYTLFNAKFVITPQEEVKERSPLESIVPFKSFMVEEVDTETGEVQTFDRKKEILQANREEIWNDVNNIIAKGTDEKIEVLEFGQSLMDIDLAPPSREASSGENEIDLNKKDGSHLDEEPEALINELAIRAGFQKITPPYDEDSAEDADEQGDPSVETITTFESDTLPPDY